MGERTKIEWTDYTFNPWRGCERKRLPNGRIHPGCEHCYAAAMAPRNPRLLGTWGADGRRVMGADEYWERPLRWNRAAERTGVRKKVFCASMGDVFEDWNIQLGGDPYVMLAVEDVAGRRLAEKGGEFRPQWPDEAGWRPVALPDLRERLFTLWRKTPWLDWQVLTKRPENIVRMWPGERYYFPNVWLGTSVSDQETADLMIPELLKCRELVPVLFLSIEPMVGPINIKGHHFSLANKLPALCANCGHGHGFTRCPNYGGVSKECHHHRCSCPGFRKTVGMGLDWVICGGESGAGARPLHPLWAKSLMLQCDAAGIPFFFKQWGEWQPVNHGLIRSIEARRFDNVGRDVTRLPGLWSEEPDGRDEFFYRVGKAAAGRTLFGREWSEFPAAVV